MQINFDRFGQFEVPSILLCNPNKDQLYSLGLCYNTKLTLNFNALSSFEFTFPQSINNNTSSLPAYSFINNKRLVLVDGYGYFQITNVQEQLTGAVAVKVVTCVGLENELVQKRLVGYNGTVKLYDPISPTGTLLDTMVNLAPTWSVGTVDGELLTKFRTFKVSDTNIYNFLQTEVETAFECVFFYDTVAKTISAKTYANALTQTDIFLSFENILDKINFSEKSDEITTALSVYGGGNLSIAAVNPLGSNKIYDFSYYTNTYWMTPDLVTAVTNWNALVNTQQPIYANLLVQLEGYNSDLLTLQAQLDTLNTDYLALQGVQKVRIQQGLSYADINAQLVAKQAQIDAQNVLISNKQAQINTTTASLTAINTLVSFNTNFTHDQFLQLSTFIYENTYKNDNIIQTDSMTLVEIQQQEQLLYNQAKTVLAKVAQPRYEIELDTVNYPFLKEYALFTQQTEMGSIVTAEIYDDVFIQTYIIHLELSFEDPTNYKMTFSNRLRLDNASYIYSDLAGQVVKTGSSVSFDSAAWANWSTDYKDDVTTFINSALDTTKNNLINNGNQEILINQNGLRGKSFDTTTNTYSGKQVWLTSNVLAFSDDGFATAKLALGAIPNPSGTGTIYGLVADAVIGRLLAGNSLTITNESNTFTVNGSGATLTNAKFTVQNTNTKLIIDPSANHVLSIQKNNGGTFNEQFWIDNTGNVNFSGTLTGANGTFSGTIQASAGNIGSLVIDSQGLKTSNGTNYLRGNGDLKWGALNITGSTAVFTGTIYADKIYGQVTDPQIASGLNAGKMTYGTMSGNQVAGGFISSTNGGGGVDAGMDLTQNGRAIVQGRYAILNSTTGVAEVIAQGNSVTIDGNIIVSGGLGQSGTFNGATHFFTFSNGILVGVI